MLKQFVVVGVFLTLTGCEVPSWLQTIPSNDDADFSDIPHEDRSECLKSIEQKLATQTISPYWDSPCSEYDVDIYVLKKDSEGDWISENHYDFDFEPDLDKSGTKGFVDGPWSHDGAYEITGNDKHTLSMSAHVGTNTATDNDFRVTLTIDSTKAIGTLTMDGEMLGMKITALTADITGKGSSASPYSAEFEIKSKEGPKSGKDRKIKITWRAE